MSFQVIGRGMDVGQWPSGPSDNGHLKVEMSHREAGLTHLSREQATTKNLKG